MSVLHVRREKTVNSGRELDALVAEKVMGCRIKDLSPSGDMNQQEYERLRNLSDHFFCGCDNREHAIGYEYGPHNLKGYSTDIAAAWEVVEKIKFMQPNWDAFGLKPNHLQMFTIEYTCFGWRAGWVPINLDGIFTIQGEAESAPHAICLAALKAVGIDIPNP